MRNRKTGGALINSGSCPLVLVTRKIHPVGQGAMYSESFCRRGCLKYLVLYDCGTSTAGTYLNREIASLPKVDYLFVSHFHNDHINGIEKLIAADKCPGKIFVPYLTPSQFILDLVYNVIESKDDTDSVDFMLRALPYLSESERNVGYPQFEIVRRDQTVTLELDHDRGIYWCYDILMESYPDSRTEELVEKILALLSMPLKSDVGNFQERDWYDKLLEALKDRDKREKIKGLYGKTFPGGHNSYSMTVHSHRYGAVTAENCSCSFSCAFSCVYTGDAEMSEMMAHKIIDLAPEYIQVPHHGSDKNHNQWIYHRFQNAFISAGEVNRYHHPSQKVIEDIDNIGAQVHLITENSEAYVKENVII